MIMIIVICAVGFVNCVVMNEMLCNIVKYYFHVTMYALLYWVMKWSDAQILTHNCVTVIKSTKFGFSNLHAATSVKLNAA